MALNKPKEDQRDDLNGHHAHERPAKLGR